MQSQDNSWLFIMRALGRIVSSPSKKCLCNRMPMINGYWAWKAKLTLALFCHQNPSQFLPPACYFNTTIVSDRLTIKGSLACPLFKDLRRRDLKRLSCCRDSRWLTINTAIHTSHKPCNCWALGLHFSNKAVGQNGFKDPMAPKDDDYMKENMVVLWKAFCMCTDTQTLLFGYEVLNDIWFSSWIRKKKECRQWLHISYIIFIKFGCGKWSKTLLRLTLVEKNVNLRYLHIME